MARADFDAALRDLRSDLVTMVHAAARAIEDATATLLRPDRHRIGQVRLLAEEVRECRVRAEREAFMLLARQQPVASDLRTVVAALRIGGECDRMLALAGHVARIAERALPGSAVPSAMHDHFDRMGVLTTRIADGAAVTLSTRDAADAARLEIDDDVVDALSRSLFGVLKDDWPHGVEAAVNLALLGRYYERFADHAVAIAQSVVYEVVGPLPETTVTMEPPIS